MRKKISIVSILIPLVFIANCSNQPDRQPHQETGKVKQNVAAVSYNQMRNAVTSGKDDEVRQYILAGADLSKRDEYGNSYLHWCDNPKVMRLLLDSGADVNARDNHGETPLHAVIRENRPELVGMLLGAGADANMRNNSGMTPLHYIGFAGKTTGSTESYARQIQVLQLLLDHGADAKAVDNRGETVLDLLTTDYKVNLSYNDLMQRIELTRILLAHGADIKAADVKGWTMMHYVAYDYKNMDTLDEKGYVAWVEFLIDNGAVISQRNKDGDLPVDIMKQRGMTPTVKTLTLHDPHYETRALTVVAHTEPLQGTPSGITSDAYEPSLMSEKELKAVSVADDFSHVMQHLGRQDDLKSSRAYIEGECRSFMSGFKEKDPKILDLFYKTCVERSLMRCCSMMQ